MLQFPKHFLCSESHKWSFWIFSLNVQFLRFIHMTTGMGTELLFQFTNIRCRNRLYLFVYSLCDKLFLLLVIRKLATTNIGTQYLGRVPCHFSWCIPVTGVIGSYANSMFNHFRKRDILYFPTHSSMSNQWLSETKASSNLLKALF